MSRKGLAGDACAIMRIHKFLEKWGLVNFVHKKPNHHHKESNNTHQEAENHHEQPQTNGFTHSTEENGYQPVVREQKSYIKRRDGFDKEKALLSKIYDKDDMELLKKITLRFRPLCDSCESLCGISWFEYREKLTRKYFHNSSSELEQFHSKTVESGEEFDYLFRVCSSCYYERSFAVVLGFDDFVKKSVLESITNDGGLDFDELYGRRKGQELSKLGDVLEKNRFNLQKCSEQLNMEKGYLMGVYLQMPVSYLEKMSRVEVETEYEEEEEDGDVGVGVNCNINKKVCVESIPTVKVVINSNDDVNNKEGNDNVIENVQKQRSEQQSKQKEQQESEEILEHNTHLLRAHCSLLQQEEREIYEEYLQAWLMKMYVKLEELEKWDKSVQWRVNENESIKKYQLAEKMHKSFRSLTCEVQGEGEINE